MKPTTYFVERSSSTSEIHVKMSGIVNLEEYVKDHNGDLKGIDLPLEGEKLHVVDIPNFPGLIEIIHEAMRPGKQLRATFEWEGQCKDNPSRVLRVKDKLYIAEISAITWQ